MGFFTTGSSGTVTGPEDFDAEAACKTLYDGLRGLGTDEAKVVNIIAGHTNEQRQEIKDKYKTMYGKDLEEELESELGGSFAKIVLALMKKPEEYIIESINQAITGIGTCEYTLISLLGTRTNDELEEIKKAYKEKYEKEMEEDIADDLSGELKSLIVGMINGGRDESEEVDPEKVQEDAKNLHEASEGIGTREEVFQTVFNLRSHEHLRQVFDAYKELSGKDIEELIESEFSGSLQACYFALVKIIRNVVEFYAERLRAAIKGAGTDDAILQRCIVLRSEVDLKDVIEVYHAKYDSSLSEDVASDTSGDYKLILEKLLTPIDPESEAVEEEVTAKDAGEGEEAIPAATEGDEEAQEVAENTETGDAPPADAADGEATENAEQEETGETQDDAPEDAQEGCDGDGEGETKEDEPKDEDQTEENEAGDKNASPNEDGDGETKEAAAEDEEAKECEAEEKQDGDEGGEQPAEDSGAGAENGDDTAETGGDGDAGADGGADADAGVGDTGTDGIDDGCDGGAE